MSNEWIQVNLGEICGFLDILSKFSVFSSSQSPRPWQREFSAHSTIYPHLPDVLWPPIVPFASFIYSPTYFPWIRSYLNCIECFAYKYPLTTVKYLQLNNVLSSHVSIKLEQSITTFLGILTPGFTFRTCLKLWWDPKYALLKLLLWYQLQQPQSNKLIVLMYQIVQLLLETTLWAQKIFLASLLSTQPPSQYIVQMTILQSLSPLSSSKVVISW